MCVLETQHGPISIIPSFIVAENMLKNAKKHFNQTTNEFLISRSGIFIAAQGRRWLTAKQSHEQIPQLSLPKVSTPL